MCISYHPYVNTDYGTRSSIVSGQNRKGNIFAVVFFRLHISSPFSLDRQHREKKDSKTGRYGVLSGNWGVGVQSWNFLRVYGGSEPWRNRVIVPARQATQAGGIHSLESIPGLHKRLKIRAKETTKTVATSTVQYSTIFSQDNEDIQIIHIFITL